MEATFSACEQGDFVINRLKAYRIRVGKSNGQCQFNVFLRTPSLLYLGRIVADG